MRCTLSPANASGKCPLRLLKGLLALALAVLVSPALSQDYAREKRWADEITGGLPAGDVQWLKQKNGHQFLGLYLAPEKSRGAAIIAHGRGWSPDFELYGLLRTKLAEMGWTTLSIQMPVLPSTAILGLYVPLYPDARERFQLAVDFLKGKGHRNIAIVSHSLGATMANQYLIDVKETPAKAWVFIGIINGLEEMFRIKIPVLDVFGSKDWEVTQVGAYERQKQISKIAGSQQVVVKDALHFFEGKEDELTGIVIGFLDSVFQGKANSAAR
jgi:pimeloyl-ACP methyl ester carboxylesterase